MGESATRPQGQILKPLRREKYCVVVLASKLDGSRERLEIPVEARDEEVAKVDAVFLARTRHGFFSGTALSVRKRVRFK